MNIFLQHLQLTGMTKLISNESDALRQYGKTILMLILARVNGYYNLYIPQTIIEEEAEIRHGEAFSPAEKEFFKHRLQTLYPKIGDSDVKTAITLLAEEKAANCPCLVHTEQRGYEWIVFRRQTDRIPCEDENDEDDVIPMDEVSDDEDFFSAEAEETILTPTSEERAKVDQDIPDDIIGAASETIPEEADFSSTDFSDGYKTLSKPQMSESLCEPSLHSRDKPNSKIQKKNDKKKKKNDSKPDEISTTLKLTPKKMKAEYYWACLGRRVEESTTTHYCTATVQKVKPITSSISEPIHMTIGCF